MNCGAANTEIRYIFHDFHECQDTGRHFDRRQINGVNVRAMFYDVTYDTNHFFGISRKVNVRNILATALYNSFQKIGV